MHINYHSNFRYRFIIVSKISLMHIQIQIQMIINDNHIVEFAEVIVIYRESNFYGSFESHKTDDNHTRQTTITTDVKTM